jgi:hypothetical protein
MTPRTVKYYVPKADFTADGDEICDAITTTLYLRKPKEDCYTIEVELINLEDIEYEM